MDNEVKEILMQLVDTTNKLAEGQKQLFEGQKETNKRLDNIENDIAEMKEDIERLTSNSNHNGEFLEKFSKFIEPYNIGIKY